VPDAPWTTVIHALLLCAVQLHPAELVTAMVAEPPDAITLTVVGAIVELQGAPAWVTVKVLPPIVSVPVRVVVVVLAATAYDTVPVPLPDAPALIVIHASLLVAVQAHPVAAVTVTVPDEPAATALADAGAIVGAHGAPAWVTVKVLPPTVTVPVRGLVVGFAVTLYVADPLPLPVAPALIVIHAALLVAVHAQPVAAVTVMVPVPDDAATFAEAGAIVGAHGAPACVTVKVSPPMVTVPVRAEVVGFAVKA
jgi:hypothetical protein